MMFSLLASRVNGMLYSSSPLLREVDIGVDFRSSDLQLLSTTAFVPVATDNDSAGPSIRWLPPSQCYLGSQDNASFHSKLFIFVNFGSAANAFLLACGTRSQPSVEEVAKILLSNPKQFYELAQGPTKYVVFMC